MASMSTLPLRPILAGTGNVLPAAERVIKPFNLEYMPTKGVFRAHPRGQDAHGQPPTILFHFTTRSGSQTSIAPVLPSTSSIGTEIEIQAVGLDRNSNVSADLLANPSEFKCDTELSPPDRSIWICRGMQELLHSEPGPMAWRGFKISARRNDTSDGVQVDVHESTISGHSYETKDQSLTFESFVSQYHTRFAMFVDRMPEWDDNSCLSGNRCFRDSPHEPDKEAILELLTEKGF